MCGPNEGHVGRPAAYVDQLLINGEGGIHHIWATDHFKSTLNAEEFRRVYRRRTNIVKEAMEAIPYGDREAQVEAIINAIRRGGLFAVDVDILPTPIGEACHVILPAATSGEMNLTSMNGERRLRLTEKYMDPPGEALPDCLIAARLANHLEKSFRDAATTLCRSVQGLRLADRGRRLHGRLPQARRRRRVRHLRPACGPWAPTVSRSPASAIENGKLIGTARLFTDGKFGTSDGKALFIRRPSGAGLQARGRQAQSEKYPFLINNGRKNMIWQNAFYDVRTPFVRERFPAPPIEMNPEDMAELGVSAGDLVEVHNDVGSTQAMVYPVATARRGECFMLFCSPLGQVGNVISEHTNELIIPNYKNVWADIRERF